MDWSMVLMLVVVGGAMYFLMIRPQQKRAKEQQEKLSKLEPGARVMTVSGIIGTVRHVGEKQVILELAPDIEMTVVKQAISTQAVEDEFEYSDAEAGDEPDADEPAIEPAAEELAIEPPTEELAIEPAAGRTVVAEAPADEPPAKN